MTGSQVPFAPVPNQTIDEFRAHTASIEAGPGYVRPAAWAVGVAVVAP